MADRESPRTGKPFPASEFCLAVLGISFVVLSLCTATALWLPESQPFLAAHLRALVMASLASAILLLVFFWFAALRPLRLLDAELGHSAKDECRWLGERVLARARRVIEENGRTKLALEESTENMRETEKLALVGKLAAGVAHSIRNPLTGLKLRMFSLTRGLGLTDRQKEHVNAINEAVAHMEKIITNFLEISRRPKLEKTRCNTSELIERVLLLLEPRIDAYKIRVERTTMAAIPDLVADGEKLCEALVNLVANACEAAGMNGTISISEEYGRLAPFGRAVVIRIRDTGPGIPENLRDVIFEPFISTKTEGTGLGLPIARRVFEEHGGWLNLHCAPGQGAMFVCVLPAEDADNDVRDSLGVGDDGSIG